RRPRFLFTFKKQGHFYRELAIDRFISAAGLNKGHQLTFVIGSSASGQNFATVSDVLDCWFKRIILPKFQRVYRLNIIMSVKQHMRSVGGWAFMMCNNHWMPRRLTKTRIKANRFEILDKPFSGLAAIGFIGWVCGNGFDTQKIKKMINALIKIGINCA